MPPAQTLARRLTGTMLPWFFLLAAGLVALQFTVYSFSVNNAIRRDLATLGRTLEPSVAEAVWELDQPALDGLAGGLRLNAIVTGVRILTDRGEVLVDQGAGPEPGSWPGLAKVTVVPLRFRSRRGAWPEIGRMELHSGSGVAWGRLRAGSGPASTPPWALPWCWPRASG
jgi:hypothetical protein